MIKDQKVNTLRILKHSKGWVVQHERKGRILAQEIFRFRFLAHLATKLVTRNEDIRFEVIIHNSQGRIVKRYFVNPSFR